MLNVENDELRAASNTRHGAKLAMENVCGERERESESLFYYQHDGDFAPARFVSKLPLSPRCCAACWRRRRLCRCARNLLSWLRFCASDAQRGFTLVRSARHAQINRPNVAQCLFCFAAAICVRALRFCCCCSSAARSLACFPLSLLLQTHHFDDSPPLQALICAPMQIGKPRAAQVPPDTQTGSITMPTARNRSTRLDSTESINHNCRLRNKGAAADFISARILCNLFLSEARPFWTPARGRRRRGNNNNGGGGCGNLLDNVWQ